MYPATYFGLIIVGSIQLYLIKVIREAIRQVKAMSDYRYQVTHGRRAGYAVIDTSTRGKVVMFASGSKRECIAEAQRLNKFTIVDGREDTYERQIYKAKMED